MNPGSAPAGGRTRIMITGGGTGGHVYPGLAVAEALGRLDGSIEVRFAGTRRGIESVLIPQAGYRLHTVPASGFRGLGPLARGAFLANALLGTLKSLVILLRWRPAVVLGTGGYASAPVMLAANLLGVPCALQEQNSVPGSANRLLGKRARRIYLGFPAAAGAFPPGRCVDTGNPVRTSFAAAPTGGETRPPGPVRRVLVFGGSRGARTLNEAVIQAAPSWGEREDLAFRIQTGTTDRDRVAAAWAAYGERAEVSAYIMDMAEALRWADLVVCRAGAMTLAEIQALGKAAVLVPFPHATDDHQLRNALECRDGGAAVVLRDPDCDGPALVRTVDEVLADPQRLRAMGEAARALARPLAARTIAEDLLELAGHPAGRMAPVPVGTGK